MKDLSRKPVRTAILYALGLLVLGIWASPSLKSQSVTIAWDPSSGPNIGGYFVYYGDVNLSTTQKINVGNTTTRTVSGLVAGTTYRFFVTAYATSGLESGPSNQITYTPPTPSNPAQATFVKKDTTTQGTWKGVYGAGGYNIINHAVNYPAYATATPSGKIDHIWTSSTSDVRALQKPASSTDRMAAAWYSTSSFTVDLNLTDGLTHRVALYCVDWDNLNRTQTVEILDASNNSVLSSQTLTAFSGGQYLVWDLKGHAIIRLTRTGSSNAVLSGLFFDSSTPAPRDVVDLTVNSSNPGSGVSITVSPNDNNSQGSGATSFTRTYNNNIVVSLTAPATAGGNNFAKWQRNGTDWSTTLNTTVTMTAAYTMTAVYVAPPPPTTRALTVNSSNPGSGVSITVSPNDNNSQGSGATSFTRTYNNNIVVSLTAPTTAGGNNFAKWQRNGTDWSTTLNTTVTMSAAYTMTAVYVVPTPTPAQATFVKKDTTTHGSWKGVYGAGGYNIINHAANYPSYATATPGVKLDYLWSSTTSDVRALQKPASAADRIAACWYSTNSFTVDLNLTDGLNHWVALYCVDWDNVNRAQTIEILDASNGSLLNRQTLAAFYGGHYVVWQIKGHVIIRLTRTGAYNTVLSGLFFDAPGTPPPPPPPAQATFVKKDSTTRGSWKGVYGASGYDVINHASNYPSYAATTPGTKTDHIWASTTSDVRALQKPASATDRIAACWYSASSFAVDLDLTDGVTHRVALYCVDWDNLNRTQTVEILDASNNSVLSSQTLTAFNGGQYLVWDLRGHVAIRLTRTGPYNAILSGLFFDPTPGVASFSSGLSVPSFAWIQIQSPQSRNGHFEMALDVDDQQQYEVQASADLVHWQTIPTAIAARRLIDNEASQFQQRFYRLVRVTNTAGRARGSDVK